MVKALDLGCRAVHSMHFSHDGKHVLIMGTGPEWNLVLLNWEKGKVTVRCPGVSSSVRWCCLVEWSSRLHVGAHVDTCTCCVFFVFQGRRVYGG